MNQVIVSSFSMFCFIKILLIILLSKAVRTRHAISKKKKERLKAGKPIKRCFLRKILSPKGQVFRCEATLKEASTDKKFYWQMRSSQWIPLRREEVKAMREIIPNYTRHVLTGTLVNWVQIICDTKKLNHHFCDILKNQCRYSLYNYFDPKRTKVPLNWKDIQENQYYLIILLNISYLYLY